jgi:hypothetical protein
METGAPDRTTGIRGNPALTFADAVRVGKPRYLADFATALRVQEVVEAFHHTNVVRQRCEPSR